MNIRRTGAMARLLWYGSLIVGGALGLTVALVAVDTYLAHSKPYAPKGTPPCSRS